ncbi:uncharacterized protein HMPREF1541_09840 [Cyphellophora europaea CBS 101466]|uniref:Uncharacterized protein n=1 Tax=Cyphellophora europaea (strain CBS 101466) TaxID=1220924 RepID=W2S8L2_CYPE1|nr:uncharacterized protein HMPREF1541_09840 [Cyphellophora europaea CBS 101466]ETN44965.1 hypothetical protein HMPREF1541_09840 [Cyphellophora europaea CBS 101466]
MASWLSAGSIDDGTVVRRVSAANPALNINATDLFSPSKLESIFTKDESLPTTDENENLSFIPSPTKVPAVNTMLDESTLPSDLSQGTSIAIQPKKRQSLGTGDYLSEASRVMTYLRQGPERKRSTLRRHPSADIEPSILYEGPDHRWVTPTDPGDLSLHLDPMPVFDSQLNKIEVKGPTVIHHEIHEDDFSAGEDEEEVTDPSRSGSDRSVSAKSDTPAVRPPSKRMDWTYEGDSPAPSSPAVSEEAFATEQRPPSVVRSPSKHSDWVENAVPQMPSSLEPADAIAPSMNPIGRSFSKRVDWVDPTLSQDSYLLNRHADTVADAKGPTVIRSPSKRVDWVEQALTQPPSPQCETMLEETSVLGRIFSAQRATRSSFDAVEERPRIPTRPIRSYPVPQYGARELSEPPPPRAMSESQIMRLPPRPAAPTPPISREYSLTTRTPHGKNYSILSLTPLPDFTMHEDDPQHPERSFIDERAHARALRQAHGTLALSRDALIKAITDACPGELYWESILTLELNGKGLTTLHGLDEFCPNLIELNVADNQITHLHGIPPSVRVLNVSNNPLSTIVAWSSLKNLQILNVSGNHHFTSLDGFGDLIHLRSLIANECAITNINGILEHDALLELQIRGNKLKSVDFGDAQLIDLKQLDLSNNQLQAVTNLQRLAKLRELHVSHNHLREIMPAGRRGPKLLEELAADHNEMQSFNFKQFPGLKAALLDNNKITRVHGFGKTRYLEELSICNQDATSDLINRIMSTPNDCFKLILSGNAVASGCLDMPVLPQHSLRQLQLVGCGIKQLGAGFGQLFPNLRGLNLNHNHISDLSDLQGMFKLTCLSVQRNRIKKMRRTCLLLARFPAISELDIRDNPLTMAFHPPAGPGAKSDAKWLRTLDENTRMRRRLTELLLAEHCKNLQSLDDIAFDRKKVLEKEEVWRKCEEVGVLQKQ